VLVFAGMNGKPFGGILFNHVLSSQAALIEAGRGSKGKFRIVF